MSLPRSASIWVLGPLTVMETSVGGGSTSFRFASSGGTIATTGTANRH